MWASRIYYDSRAFSHVSRISDLQPYLEFSLCYFTLLYCIIVKYTYPQFELIFLFLTFPDDIIKGRKALYGNPYVKSEEV